MEIHVQGKIELPTWNEVLKVIETVYLIAIFDNSDLDNLDDNNLQNRIN